MSKTGKELTVFNYSKLTTYILGSKRILTYSAHQAGKDSIIFNYGELTSYVLDSKGFLTYSTHWDHVQERCRTKLHTFPTIFQLISNQQMAMRQMMKMMRYATPTNLSTE